MKNLTITIAAMFTIFVCCNKERSVHIHCENLVNEALPAGDQAILFVPNAFTPNGDGINDGFKVYAVEISSISIKVFDSKSKLVFETTQMGDSWNISPVPANQTYYYRVEALTLTNTRIGQCGTVMALKCKPGGQSLVFEDQLTPFGFTGISADPLANCN